MDGIGKLHNGHGFLTFCININNSASYRPMQNKMIKKIVGTLADLRYSFLYAYLISYRGGYVDSNEKEVMV